MPGLGPRPLTPIFWLQVARARLRQDTRGGGAGLSGSPRPPRNLTAQVSEGQWRCLTGRSRKTWMRKTRGPEATLTILETAVPQATLAELRGERGLLKMAGSKMALGISLVVQWLRLHTLKCRGPGFDPWPGN